jgi:hypothetical protein
MQARLRFGSAAARAANVSNQPDIEEAITPAADRRSHSRRVKRGEEVRDIVYSPCRLRLIAKPQAVVFG